MKLLATLMRLLAALLRLLPCRQRVALMSRQSGTVSLDYQLLEQELCERLGSDAVAVCVCEPETKDKRAFVSGTLRQLLLACTSKVVVADGYIPAVCIPPQRKGCTYIQLWHALGAMKRFGYQSVDTPAGRSSEQARAACMHKNYDLIIASGPGAVSAYSEAFGYPASSFAVTGLPRMDYLLDPSPSSARRARMERIVRKNPVLANGKPTIVYAPTLRKGASYEGWIERYLEPLAQACPPDRANLVFAGHPLDRAAGARVAERYECLHVIEGAATIDLLGLASCVITDYSAIALEAGLLRVSTCFYAPDLEEYSASPGLNVDLAGGELGLCSGDATRIMAAALGELPEAEEDFARFQRFCDGYFEGVGLGSTARIAALIEDALKR